MNWRARPGRQLVYSVGWELAERERRALARVPRRGVAGRGRWPRPGPGTPHRGRLPGARLRACRGAGSSEAHVTRADRAAARRHRTVTSCAGWPASMRIFARREKPHPGAQLSLFEEADGWRYSLWVSNLPAALRGWRAQLAYIDAAHRVHAPNVATFSSAF